MTRAELAELNQQPRPERLRRLWAALSPDGRAKAWAEIPVDGRVDVIAACFDAEEVPVAADDS